MSDKDLQGSNLEVEEEKVEVGFDDLVGDEYKVTVVDGVITIGEKLAYSIQTNELMLKKMEAYRDKYRKELADAMVKADISRIDNDYFFVTLIPEETKVSLDTKKVKENYEEVFLECQKKTTTKAYVKIATK